MQPDPRSVYHGKLLLTGEYFVLDGVPSLAVPTKLGQQFQVNYKRSLGLTWRAYDHEGNQWFDANIAPAGVEGGLTESTNNDDFTKRLKQILQAADELNPGALNKATNSRIVTTRLEFNRHWGLGSSSTLIAAVAEWLEVNPYELLERTFGGSGYDLACAIADGPILYERNGTTPKVTPLNWRPEWTAQTYFIYRNQKQNSREGIRAYRKARVKDSAKQEISEITTALLQPSLHLRAAAQLLKRHEEIVAKTLGMQPVQQELFKDFPGQLKSLGAWGGDFIWALSEEGEEAVRGYFARLGYGVVVGYGGMVW